MINNKLKKYIFIKNLDENIKKYIKKLNNVQIIFNNEHFDNFSLKECLQIKDFCTKNKIPLYIINNYKIALKIKANGIFISSQNKRINLNDLFLKKFDIMGSAHNQLEYYFKKIQQCKTITLSPLFSNPKYTDNQILNILKFNIISLNWKLNICALGGINCKNFKKISCTRATSLAFRRAIKNPLTN
jgi:thiamine-phosphate pyrophosphorylase